MAFVKRNSILLILSFIIAPASYSEIVELETKQLISKIRYISTDGKYTYYQKHNGSLFFSSNYKVEQVIQGTKHSQYQLTSSTSKQNLIIMQDDTYQSQSTIRKNKKIYSVPYGNSSAVFIGEGSNTKIHMEDLWSSFFNFSKNKIFFSNLDNPALKFSIKLLNKIDRYFMPEVAMITTKDIIYTDINAKGIQGVIHLDRNTKKSQLLFKSNSFSQRIELCETSDNIFIAIIGRSHKDSGTQIYKFPKKDFSIKKMTSIYESPHNDLGHLICDYSEDKQEKIIFIQTKMSFNNQFKKYVASEINLKDKKVTTIYKDKPVFNLIRMDQKILIPYGGKYLVLKGESKLVNDNLID